MFLGTTPTILGQYLAQELQKNRPKRFLVPFAGNFTLEKIAYAVDPKIPVVSTDISLYSTAIGWGVTGQDFKCELKGQLKEDFPFFAKLTEPMDKAITVMFCLEVGEAYSKRKIAFYNNLYNSARNSQELFYKNIRKKLENFRDNNNMTFIGQDAIEFLKEQAQEGDMIVFDHPSIDGGYEKMFKIINDSFDYDPLPYTDIVGDTVKNTLTMLAERNATVYARGNKTEAEIPNTYKEVYRYEKYGTLLQFFSNKQVSTWVGKYTALRERIKNYLLISEEDEITENSKIELIRVSVNEINHYRLLWVKKATQTRGGYGYLVVCDGKLIGALVLDSQAMKTRYSNPYITIFTDLAVPLSRYKRLSKLILYVCCTKELLAEFNDYMMYEHEGFSTVAYTNGAVSMKYRSLFELQERGAGNAYYKNKLVYQNRSKILPTYKDGLKKWLEKDAKVISMEDEVIDS